MLASSSRPRKKSSSLSFRGAAGDEESRKASVFRARFLAKFTLSSFTTLRTVRTGRANGLEMTGIRNVLPRPARSRSERAPQCALTVACLVALTFISGSSSTASAQDPISTTIPTAAAFAGGSEETTKDPATTVFDHPATTKYWISGQMNWIGQGHGAFPAEYSGPNSLKNTSEFAVSEVVTLYTGYEATQNLQVLVDIEEAGGKGISSALGLAGFTNLDVVRNPYLGGSPYLARALVRYTIPLGGGETELERSWLNLATRAPSRRLEIVAGKLSLPDFFDANDVGSDSHLQFMNWTDDQNGAWDYAANTRGYTDGAVLQYFAPGWVVRFGEALMPKTANGIFLDADIARAHADNFEFELHPHPFGRHSTVVRLLSYVNHANMGSYRRAVDNFRAGLVSVPDITTVRRQGRKKYGFGLNLQQGLPHNFEAYSRWGWSDGRNESFAYTEVDRTAAAGIDLRGNGWRRRLDRIGAAFVVNGLSGDHREYLALGGLGFLLGDGKLNYGTERIFEAYYTAHLWRGFWGSLDLQHVRDPGYNRDRGPVTVPSMRLHVDF